MKTRFAVLIVVVMAIWGLKRYYADATADQLWWILAPTASLVQGVTGAGFTLVPGEGYFSSDRLFLIEKSCAGINFMIAALGMVALARVHRVESMASGVRVLGVGLAMSYVAAVLVNASRIAVAIWLTVHPVAAAGLSSTEIHRIEGIVVYFGGLVLLHELVQHVERRAALEWDKW